MTTEAGAAVYCACRHLGESTPLTGRAGRCLRTHCAPMVNLGRIRGLEMQSDGEYEVVLKSGARLSRRYRKSLQERLGR